MTRQKKIIEKNLSVRQAEQLAKKSANDAWSKKSVKAKPKDVDTIALERDLSNLLGLKVSVEGDGPKGELRIAYDNLDQLDFVIDRLKAAPVTSSPVVDEEADTGEEAAEVAPMEPAPKLSVSLKPKKAKA